MLIQQDSGDIVKRFLLSLQNRGAPAFEFANTISGATYQFAMQPDNAFAISLVGSGRNELKIAPNGRVVMGQDKGGGPDAFDLKETGDLFIGGEITALSDANAKIGFGDIDTTAVLDGVLALSITEWSYRDNPAVRHLGPTAQDFNAAFGLGGSDTGIGMLDGNGIALASIQALAAENQALRAEIGDLEARLGELEAALTLLLDDPLVVHRGEVVLEDAGWGCPAECSVGSVVIVEMHEPGVGAGPLGF